MLSSPLTLRVSVVEQCQYRCPYCLPGSKKSFLPKPQWLSLRDYQHIANSFSIFNLTKIRFTGGEPLLRTDLPQIISVFKKQFPNTILGLTTNGQLLNKTSEALRHAGLQTLTLHLDTLKPDRYPLLMGKGCLDTVLSTFLEAHSSFDEVKINMVVQKGENNDEILDFIHFSEKSKVEVRFIELMNTGSAPGYVKKHFFSGQSILDSIRTRYPLFQVPKKNPSDPASLWRIDSKNLTFGLIASDTQPFCNTCNRLRLSSDGHLRGCLYETEGIALKPLLEQENPVEALRHGIKLALHQKQSFHPLVRLSPTQFSMAEIGG